jgi:multiple sugar transport system permease protein
VTTQTIPHAGTARQAARAGRAAPAQPQPGQGRNALWLLAPFVLLYLLFVIGPTIYGLIMSFFDASLVRPGLGDFVGLSNYAEALGSSDFWSSLWHTIWFTILTTPPLVVLAFVFALLADRVSRGRASSPSAS